MSTVESSTKMDTTKMLHVNSTLVPHATQLFHCEIGQENSESGKLPAFSHWIILSKQQGRVSTGGNNLNKCPMLQTCSFHEFHYEFCFIVWIKTVLCLDECFWSGTSSSCERSTQTWVPIFKFPTTTNHWITRTIFMFLGMSCKCIWKENKWAFLFILLQFYLYIYISKWSSYHYLSKS